MPSDASAPSAPSAAPANIANRIITLTLSSTHLSTAASATCSVGQAASIGGSSGTIAFCRLLDDGAPFVGRERVGAVGEAGEEAREGGVERGVTRLELFAEAGVLAVRLEPAPQRVERQRPAPPDPAAGDM